MDRSATDQIRGSYRRGAACKGGKLYEPVRGSKKDCKSGSQAGSGGNSQDVGGNQRIAEHSLIGSACCGQGGSDKDSGQDPGKTNIPENGNGLGKDFSLIPEPG